MANYACKTCNKTKDGRFTRGPSDAIPKWYCWECLKAGQGKDETKETATQKVDEKRAAVSAVLPATTPQRLDKTREEGQALILPLKETISTIDITGQDDYLQMDTALGRVRQARKQWGERMERIIRPIRQGLEELYSLNREVDKPLEQLELLAKSKMRDFKLEEQRQLRAEEDARQAEARRLREEAEAAQRKAEAAKAPALKQKFDTAARVLESKADTVEFEESVAPVIGNQSSSRAVKKPRVVDLDKFLAGVVQGYVPKDCLKIEVRASVLTRYYQEDPDGFESWPGVEVVDDIQISGR